MAVKDFDISKEILHTYFTYNDGMLYWKVNKWRSPRKAGDKAGRIVKDGYLQTCLNGKRLLNHQIVFMMFNGYIPKEIDHIDRDVANNRIENLRETTRSENLKNRKTWTRLGNKHGRRQHTIS